MWNPFNSNKAEQRTITASPSGGFFDVLLPSSKDALTLPTAYACVRTISNSVAQTELRDVLDTSNGKTHLKTTQITKLLKNPYPNVSYFQFMSTMVTSLVGKGNAYAYIVRNDQGSPIELMYIPNESVSVQETFRTSQPFYYQLTDASKEQLIVWPEDMLHFKNISLDNIIGINPIQFHALTFDSSAAMGNYINTFMGKANQISGVIESDKKLTTSTVEQIRESFGKIYGGHDNAGKTAVLSDSMKYKQLKPISPLDADYIKTRQLSDNDIMRIFGVPPPMIGQMDATYNNTEQLSLIYARNTLQPVFESIQQEMGLKLIPSRQQQNRSLEFTPNTLKMATARDKAETLALLKREGIYTGNEVREEYGLTKHTGLDEITLPLNIAPASLHKEVLTPVEPEPVETVETEVIEEKQQTQPAQSRNIDLVKQLNDVKAELGRLKRPTEGKNHE